MIRRVSPRIENDFPEYRRLCSADSRQQPSKKTSTGQDKQAMKTLFKTIAIRERDDSNLLKQKADKFLINEVS